MSSCDRIGRSVGEVKVSLSHDGEQARVRGVKRRGTIARLCCRQKKGHWWNRIGGRTRNSIFDDGEF